MDDLRERRFKILSDPNRIRILAALKSESKMVNELAKDLKIERTLLSHHLAVLKKENLVECKKTGRETHYRLKEGILLNKKKNQFDFGCCKIQFQ